MLSLDLSLLFFWTFYLDFFLFMNKPMFSLFYYFYLDSLFFVSFFKTLFGNSVDVPHEFFVKKLSIII